MSILGTRVVRTEDPLFLTRGAVYTDDLVDDRLAGAVHVTFVRSPGRARPDLRRSTPSAALEAPGVVAVFTAADLADLAPIPAGFPMSSPRRCTRRLLAKDVVRFVGEPVAVVLTEERYQGEDAAELVDVDYDPLPAVVDPRGRGARRGAAVPRARAPTSCAAFGEPAPEDFFDGCEVVVTERIVNQRVAAGAAGDPGRARPPGARTAG